MDQPPSCQSCGTRLSEAPRQDKPVACPECGTVNAAAENVQKTIAQQLSELSVDMKPEEIELALSTINTCFGQEILLSRNVGATVRTMSDKVKQFAARVKRKCVDAEGREEAPCDYRIREKLGEGGMGVIYLAEQSSLRRSVALKMTKESGRMSDAMMETFLTEALVTGDFDHPNVVPIYDAGIDFNGNLFYVMKRVQGVSWETLLHPKTGEEKELAATYTLTDHLNILNSVCNAVAFAHSRNVIHRDLKPSNVMIGEFGEVIVLDWGLAAGVGPNDKVAPIEDLSTFGGTVIYMAPEMARVQKTQIGTHSDVYLLGAILYEVLTGHAPHPGKTFKEAIVNAMLNRIQPPDREQDIDRVLMETALKAMSIKPTQRYLSVGNFQRALKKYIQGKASHIKSVQLSGRGTAFLQEGAAKADSGMIIRSSVVFDMALEFWDGNREAELGKSRAELLLINAALESGEMDVLFSSMREKNQRVDMKFQAEKEDYARFKARHRLLAPVLSREAVYLLLKRLDSALMRGIETMNSGLKVLFMVVLLALPVLMYWPGAPFSYVVFFSLVSVCAVASGELLLRKLLCRKKRREKQSS